MTDEPIPARAIPSVEHLASDGRLLPLGLAPTALRNAIRAAIEAERREPAVASRTTSREATQRRIVERILDDFGPRPGPVINATGILIHTNLGRVGVSDAAAAAMAEAATSTVALEVEPGTGRRGGRQRRVVAALRALTGCEHALIVNNNAAALSLAMAALAGGREVIVSRGEAVEIGGGFRIPDVLRQAGATLVEVGTTNRTYPADYERAITPGTAVLLKVHPGNFAMRGYVRSTTAAELITLRGDGEIAVVEDQGDGLPVRLDLIPGVRSLADCVADGVDLALASGDKLLGGPQAGIIVGRRDLVRRLAGHPLARAVRVDKVTLAGLEATLDHWLRDERETAIPLWRAATVPVEALRERAARVGRQLGPTASVVGSVNEFGGGAITAGDLPGMAVRVDPDPEHSTTDLARRLRTGARPVWPRVERDAVYIEMRTVAPQDDEVLVSAILTALGV